MLKFRLTDIFKLALPGMLAALVNLASTLFCIRMLGQYNSSNYYLFAIFLPINYLLIAIYESVRAASLTLNSRQIDAMNIIAVIILTIITFFILLVFFLVFKGFIFEIIRVNTAEQKQFFYFSIMMIVVGGVNAIAYIFSSTCYAIRKPILGMLLALFMAVLTCGLTRLLIGVLNPNWLAYIIAVFIAGSISSLIVIFYLSAAGVRLNSNGEILLRSLPARCILAGKISLPVLASYLVIFSSLFFINLVLSKFGPAVVVGFSIAYRIQNLIILPAVALGSALAILSGECLAEFSKK